MVRDRVRNREVLLPAPVRAFRQTGFNITAAGTGTQETAEAMAGIGCDYLQG